jgi:hypothetical protein
MGTVLVTGKVRWVQRDGVRTRTNHKDWYVVVDAGADAGARGRAARCRRAQSGVCTRSCTVSFAMRSGGVRYRAQPCEVRVVRAGERIGPA